MNNKDKITNLILLIKKHKRLYYSGSPIISDAEYDALESELKRLDPHHPILEEVGSGDILPDEKVMHDIPMLSLDKTYDYKDLVKWKASNELIGTHKIDGNSCSIIYENGILVVAKSRGNGRFGENVTNKIKWINSIPKKINLEGKIEIRGEIFCYKEKFYKLADEMDSLNLEKPTSERNIVAGLLGRKDNIYLSTFLDFFAYEIIGMDLKLEEDSFKYLLSLGFVTPYYQLIKSEEEMHKFLQETKKFMEESTYGVDGAVFSFNDIALHKSLGSTAHHPRYKISFKWQGDVATTKILKIEWSISRSGILTPIAIVEPVQLSSAKIQNVTLHNGAVIKTYKLKAKDVIEIIRSGEVIPKFLRVVEHSSGSFEFPTKCPSCNSDLYYDGVRLNCSNKSNCPAQNLYQILHWINSVNIEDLSEKRLTDMIEKGLVKKISDLYRLTITDLLSLDLTKKKMAEKLLNNIEKTKKLPLAVFLNGLGLKGAGLATLEKISNEFKTLDNVLSITPRDIDEIDGFGEKSSTVLIESLKEKKGLIGELIALGVSTINDEISTKTAKLSGLKFVITGELSKPRKEIEDLIKENGGQISSSVSKNTDYLLTNESESSSSKFKKAKELNIKIISEEMLQGILNGDSSFP